MFLQVQGVEMPQTTEIQVDTYTITESERNDSGYMIHEFIAKKRKLTASIGVLTHSERQSIYNAINQNNGLSLTVTYHSPETGTPQNMNCYVGDRSIKLLKCENGIPTYWSDFKLTLIEN